MKRCPTCQQTYTDESLNFCLADGAPLLVESNSASSFDSGATLVMGEQTESLVIPPPPTEVFVPRGAPTDVMPGASGTVHAPPRNTAPDAYIAAQPPKAKSHLLTAGITAIAILLLVLVGIGIALLMRGTGDNQTGANGTSNGNSPQSARSENSSPKTNSNNQNATVPSSNSEASAPGSLNITATASSTRAPLKALSYTPANALDNSLLTAWIEGIPGAGVGEWIRCEFDREVKLNSVVMTPGYFKTASLWKQNNRMAAATLYFSDGSSLRFTFPDRMQMQTLDTGGIRTRFVRLVIDDFYPGSTDSEDTPISEMSFNWEP
jgi:hypothetical protein